MYRCALRCLMFFTIALVVEEDVLYVKSQSEPPLQDIHIGGLFEEANSTAEIAFKAAVSYVNQEGLIPGKRLVPRVSIVAPHDSFHVEKVLCEMSSEGIAGVLGPRSPLASRHLQSICDALEIPHLSARWDLSQRRSACLVNMFPHQQALSEVVIEIVRAWGWRGFTVLYDDYESLIRIREMVEMADDKGFLVAARQLEHHDESGFRIVLRDVQYSQEKNIIVQCSDEYLFEVLLQAQQVGLMGHGYNYIIMNLDFHAIDYTPFMWGGTNITTLRMVNPDKPYVQEMVKLWEAYQAGEMDESDEQVTTTTSEYSEVVSSTPMPEPENSTVEPITPTTEDGLVFDAVLLFAKALQHFEMISEMKLECGGSDSWYYGYSIINYIKLSELDGMSGRVKFDHEGFRSEVEFDIYELSVSGLNWKGSWNGTLYLAKPKPPGPPTHDGEDLRNITFTVLIALTKPYNMLKEDSQALQGNDRYEGFGIELIHELSLMSGFNYTFVESPTTSSGNPTEYPNGTRVWDGMIGEVLKGNADLAIADITITDERIRDADFTHPFMNLGISILYRAPTKARPSLFSFLDPFTSGVWGCMMSAYFGVSLLLFVMGRISPYEWTNPYPCIQEPEALENQFSLINSFWFTVGSVMQQGSEIAPIAASTRMVASIWWFFTLIMVSSYTAQLATFLTVQDPYWPFKDVNELASQNVIKYGAKKKGATFNSFRDSNNSLHRTLYQFMLHHPDCMMEDNDKGVKKVLEGTDYAFFMEDTSIQYEVERECNLTQIGERLDNKGYGIVLRQNSTYRNVLSKHIVQMQEMGKLQMIKDKWWKEKRGGGACGKEDDAASAMELKLENTGGVFVVLLCGCLFGVVIAIFEILWDVAQRENKVSFKHELIEELKFIMQCRATVKPIRNYSLTNTSLNEQTVRNSRESDMDSSY